MIQGDLSLTQSTVTPLKFHGLLTIDPQHLVKEIPSYIKDANDFVNKINTLKVSEN